MTTQRLLPAPIADRIKNGSLTTALVINEPMRLSWGNLNWQIRRVFGEKRNHTEPSAVAVLGHPQNNQTGEAEPGRNRTLPDSLQGSWRKRPPALCCPTGCWINYSLPSYTVYEMVNCGPGEDPAWGWFVLILSHKLKSHRWGGPEIHTSFTAITERGCQRQAVGTVTTRVGAFLSPVSSLWLQISGTSWVDSKFSLSWLLCIV